MDKLNAYNCVIGLQLGLTKRAGLEKLNVKQAYGSTALNAMNPVAGAVGSAGDLIQKGVKAYQNATMPDVPYTPPADASANGDMIQSAPTQNLWAKMKDAWKNGPVPAMPTGAPGINMPPSPTPSQAAAPAAMPPVDKPIKNPAAQFAGVNDPKAVPEQITGQFTGDNGLVAPTSTHFNPVSAEQPFDPRKLTKADKAWFRKDTGTAFNPKSVADVNYFMNRRRNNATMGEADAMEKMRARQNVSDNTATRQRLTGGA